MVKKNCLICNNEFEAIKSTKTCSINCRESNGKVNRKISHITWVNRVKDTPKFKEMKSGHQRKYNQLTEYNKKNIQKR